jgi:hypothetical protein
LCSSDGRPGASLLAITDRGLLAEAAIPDGNAAHEINEFFLSEPGAPLVVAGNQYAYASQPLLLAAWGQRWRQHGASPDEVRVKLAKILEGADPPHSEAAVKALLHESGFGDATRFFSSLFWSAWLTCRAA